MFEQEYGTELGPPDWHCHGRGGGRQPGRNEFMVTGEVPNLAARLQAVGEGITVSETTYRLLAPRLEAEREAALI